MHRSMEAIYHHYEVEKKLAAKLRTANRAERLELYPALYDELFRRVPDHPQVIQKQNLWAQRRAAACKLRLIKRFLRLNINFLELGAGDCSMAIAVARYVRQVYAVDVSFEIVKNIALPKNCKLVLSDGLSLNVKPETIGIAYSNQLMEHLHPDDAEEQLRNVFKALAPGGIYICITPNRLAGPHDISQYFDDEATGFHLKEYTLQDLVALFRKIGFSRLSAYMGGKGVYWRAPLGLAIFCERALKKMPRSWRRRLSRTTIARAFLGINLVAIK